MVQFGRSLDRILQQGAETARGVDSGLQQGRDIARKFDRGHEETTTTLGTVHADQGTETERNRILRNTIIARLDRLEELVRTNPHSMPSILTKLRTLAEIQHPRLSTGRQGTSRALEEDSDSESWMQRPRNETTRPVNLLVRRAPPLSEHGNEDGNDGYQYDSNNSMDNRHYMFNFGRSMLRFSDDGESDNSDADDNEGRNTTAGNRGHNSETESEDHSSETESEDHNSETDSVIGRMSIELGHDDGEIPRNNSPAAPHTEQRLSQSANHSDLDAEGAGTPNSPTTPRAREAQAQSAGNGSSMVATKLPAAAEERDGRAHAAVGASTVADSIETADKREGPVRDNNDNTSLSPAISIDTPEGEENPALSARDCDSETEALEAGRADNGKGKKRAAEADQEPPKRKRAKKMTTSAHILVMGDDYEETTLSEDLAKVASASRPPAKKKENAARAATASRMTAKKNDRAGSAATASRPTAKKDDRAGKGATTTSRSKTVPVQKKAPVEKTAAGKVQKQRGVSVQKQRGVATTQTQSPEKNQGTKSKWPIGWHDLKPGETSK